LDVLAMAETWGGGGDFFPPPSVHAGRIRVLGLVESKQQPGIRRMLNS